MIDKTPMPDDAPQITRIRHETRRRDLEIVEIKRLTPCMIRLTVAGPELEGFASAGFDDHIKLFVPDGAEGAMRDYTPRHYDAALGQLVIDVVDHVGGPAADWARTASVGDRAIIGGPRGSKVIGGNIDHWVLIGDETALPAIGRQIEALPHGTRVTAIIAVPSAADEQRFESQADVSLRWIHRPMAMSHDCSVFDDAIYEADLPTGTFAWIAAEANVARAVRDRLLARGLPLSWLTAAGYWLHGSADGAVKPL